MRRISYIPIFVSFILLIGTISFLKFQDDRIFERIIAQEDISIKNNNSLLLLQDNQTELSIYNKNIIIVQLLANQLETKLNKSAALLELASESPQIKALPNASLINPSFHGIPKDADMEKRQVAQNILSIDKDFGRIFFLMPNGDMYFEEPFSVQEKLTRDNFAFRDYYKEAVSTGDTYLGNVIISASSGLPQVNIAIPLYSSANDNSSSSNVNNTENLIGLLIGDQDIPTINKFLQSLPLTENETAIYVDNNGQIIASSSLSPSSPINKQGQSNDGSNISSLQSFKDVISGKSGYNIENINDKDMLIVYAPVKFKSTIWGVLFFSPL